MCADTDLHRPRQARAVYTHRNTCKCTRTSSCTPRHAPTCHGSPRPPAAQRPHLAQANPPFFPRPAPDSVRSSPQQRRNFWTHFQVSPRHAPSTTRPASVPFPLEKTAVNPLVPAPGEDNSPIARQEGGAGLWAAERPRSASRLGMDAAARAHS